MNKSSQRYPAALTIAGSDSGGCAGIQADLKTFSSIGVFGASVVTSVTAQNTKEVRAVHPLSADIVRQQTEAVLDDIIIDVVKTGMLPSVEIIEMLASLIDAYNIRTIIVDPVMVATSGARLASSSTASAFRDFLYSRLTLITPNIPEAEALSGLTIQSEKEMYHAGDILLEQGCRSVLIKGGHLRSGQSTDILFQPDRKPLLFSSPRINSGNLHGTGCSFSSAIAAYMALGNELENAVSFAKSYISSAIYYGKDAITGKGYGPVNHFFEPQSLKYRTYEY